MANLYRDGKDTVGWHSGWHCHLSITYLFLYSFHLYIYLDDEPMLGKHPYIASLSFGDIRTFEMRRKLPLGTSEEEYKYVQHVKIPVTHGSLLIMEGATQDDWQVQY